MGTLDACGAATPPAPAQPCADADSSRPPPRGAAPTAGAQPDPPLDAAPLRSPEPASDGRVTFRHRAPHAEAVVLNLEGSEPVAMSRDARGVWSATVGPLAPDVYGYSFAVDGVSAVDPSNPVLKPGLLGVQSIADVPGATPAPWEVGDVPHGVLHRHAYRSRLVGDQRELYVYTPPDYDAAAGRRAYPVLYLLHGFSDDASAWTAVGRAHVILDNLIAQGRAAPMIVAMPLGYGAPEILGGGFAGFWRDRDLRRRNIARFVESLLGEVLPRVEAAYRVRAEREWRAVAGLSMGGAEALLAGLNHGDTFGWVGAFSSGGLDDDLAAQLPGAFRGAARPPARSPRLLWVTCGTKDDLFEGNRRLREWLHEQGLEPTGADLPGGHTWMVWRRNLTSFAGLLFR